MLSIFLLHIIIIILIIITTFVNIWITLLNYFRSVWLFGLGISISKTMSVFAGLLMYAKYADCDPFTTGQVSKNDQLLPYYVMNVAAKVPGLSGLFIAGVVSAALRYNFNLCITFLINYIILQQYTLSVFEFFGSNHL